MVWLISLVVAVALIFGGFYYWARHRALVAAEPHGQPSVRRLWLLVEALTLVGAVFLLAGGSIAASENWQNLSDWGHVTIFAGAGVLFLMIGLRLRRITQSAVARVTGTVWLACVGCIAAATAIAAHDVYAQRGPVTTLATGIAISACSAALWLAFKHEWQMAGLFSGMTITICGAILTVTGTASPWLAVSLGMWALGLGWTILGRWYPDPLWSSVPLGTALALISPSFSVWDHGWVFVVAIVTAAAAMAASVPLKNSMLLIAGTISLACYIVAAVARYHRALFGLPGTLAIAGILILAIAVVTARIWHATLPPDDGGLEDLIGQPPRPPIPRTS